MGNADLAIVIPAFNEEKTIGTVVNNIKQIGTVIVVNDASTDNTKHVAEQAGASVVNHNQNRGYDSALDSGFKAAKKGGFRYVITFDADGQHEPDCIGKYIKILKTGDVDMVLGRRPSKPRITETLIGIYFKYRFGISDILCGMKGYNLKVYNEHGCFDHVKSIGSELTMVSVKRGFKFSELDVPIFDREGEPRFGNIMKSNFRIAKALIRVILLDILFKKISTKI